MNMPLWLQALAAACVLAIIVDRLLLPLAFDAYEAWRIKRNRAELQAAGLTPEQYMATLSPLDYQSYSEAVVKFWPRRRRQERREATLDRIGAALGPTSAKDIRDLKAIARRLDQF